MIWKITAYNGTSHTFDYGTKLETAIELFLSVYKLTQWDIKSIVNLH